MTRRYDLDELLPESTVIVVEGVEYLVESLEMEGLPDLLAITKEYKLDKMDPEKLQLSEKEIEGLGKLFAILVPTLPSEVFNRLKSRQLMALQHIIGEYIRPSQEELEAFLAKGRGEGVEEEEKKEEED